MIAPRMYQPDHQEWVWYPLHCFLIDGLRAGSKKGHSILIFRNKCQKHT